MQSNKEILEEFGKILIDKAHDPVLEMISHNIKTNIQKAESPEQLLRKIDQLLKDAFQSTMFQFLDIFEEREDYKLIYEENGKQVDLNEASGMLKGELYGEDGWMEKFSKFKSDEE